LKSNKHFVEIKNKLNQYKIPILYSGGSIAKAFSTMIVGFIIAKYISPDDLGLWTTINLAVAYSVFFQAGIINGLNLELPLALGKGDEEGARRLAGTVQTFTLFSCIIILAIGLSWSFIFSSENAKMKFGILSITIIIIGLFYQNYLMSTFRSKNSFLKLSFIQFTDAFVNLITIISVVYFAFYGLLIKAVLSILIYVTLLHIFRPIKINLVWNKSAFITLLKIGLPIFGLVYLDSFSSTVDKLFILHYSNLKELGLYAFGFYAFSVFTLFSASLASYIYPRMTFNYGQNKDTIQLWRYVKKITILLLIIQIPLAIIGFLAIPMAVNTFFPNYIESVIIMQILIFAGVFKGSVIGVNALWSLKKWKYMISYQVIYSSLLVISTFIGIHVFTNKLEGVAYGVLLANVLNLISALFLTFFATHSNINSDQQRPL
jgi:O-antigen/teichoic acid export membrane protein